MKIKFGEMSELILLEYKGGEFNIELSEKELGEYRIVEKMFFEWQNKLKERAKDKYERNIYQKKFFDGE